MVVSNNLTSPEVNNGVIIRRGGLSGNYVAIETVAATAIANGVNPVDISSISETGRALARMQNLYLESAEDGSQMITEKKSQSTENSVQASSVAQMSSVSQKLSDTYNFDISKSVDNILSNASDAYLSQANATTNEVLGLIA